MESPKSLALLGAGNRGRRVYSKYILENKKRLKLVSLAEPIKERREIVAGEHGLKSGDVFSCWEELLSAREDLDGVIVSTMDRDHLAPTLKALQKGCKVLLEKPMATKIEDLLDLTGANQAHPEKIIVAHVLRYTRFYKKIKEILDKKVVGKVRLVQHTEKIGFFHFAHSFVRGNWRKEENSCPIILAKCCHDLDLLQWWLPHKCTILRSRGQLSFFNSENKPREAGDRCLQCSLERTCAYSATKIYLAENTDWPVTAITEDLTPEGIKKALEEGPYGRCVFACDNDVPDLQTVEMEFEDDLIVQFALTGFSGEINRTTNIFGTKGEIRGDFASGKIVVEIFGQEKEEINLAPDRGDHGGGDLGLMDSFTRFLQGEKLEISSGGDTSLESHLLALAAEESRKEKKDIAMSLFRENFIENKKGC